MKSSRIPHITYPTLPPPQSMQHFNPTCPMQHFNPTSPMLHFTPTSPILRFNPTPSKQKGLNPHHQSKNFPHIKHNPPHKACSNPAAATESHEGLEEHTAACNKALGFASLCLGPRVHEDLPGPRQPPHVVHCAPPRPLRCGRKTPT